MTEHDRLSELRDKIDYLSMVAVLAAIGASNFDDIPRDGVHVFDDVIYVERYIQDAEGDLIASLAGKARFLRNVEEYDLKDCPKAREVIEFVRKITEGG